ncbi:pseudouridine synthase [Patescibacteria group bacterium]|nr:pseudouridine synthase [Patescibacteria group bacterium]
MATRYDTYAFKKVVDLVPHNPPVYPVGRLDKDTEGLLIMTNDGELTNQLTHPKHHAEKEYFVIASPRFEDFRLDMAIKKLSKGILITGYLTKPAQVTNVREDRSKISFNITIREGKHHQIHRMCHNVGLKVQKLVRVRIGPLKLGKMKKGEYRALKDNEIKTLINIYKHL